MEYLIHFGKSFDYDAIEDIKSAVKEWLPSYDSCGFDVYYTKARYGCGVYLRQAAMPEGLEELDMKKGIHMGYFTFGKHDPGFAMSVAAAICLDTRRASSHLCTSFVGS